MHDEPQGAAVRGFRFGFGVSVRGWFLFGMLLGASAGVMLAPRFPVTHLSWGNSAELKIRSQQAIAHESEAWMKFQLECGSVHERMAVIKRHLALRDLLRRVNPHSYKPGMFEVSEGELLALAAGSEMLRH